MNVGALLAPNYAIANQMNHIRRELDKSNERLSTGKHFKSPVDIITASRIEMEMRASRVLQGQFQEEIARGQTKENALDSVADKTQELAELTKKYEDAGLNLIEKSAIKKEMEKLMNGIKDVLSIVEFAGQKLFDKDTGLLGFVSSLPILNLIGGSAKAKELVEKVAEERADNASDIDKAEKKLEKAVKDDNHLTKHLSAIQDVDVAKELLNKTKLELLLDSNVSLFTHNIENSRSLVYQLLR